MLEESVISSSGLYLHRNMIDTIKYLKVNALMHTVGNLMMLRVHILVLMRIIKFNFVELKEERFDSLKIYKITFFIVLNTLYIII